MMIMPSYPQFFVKEHYFAPFAPFFLSIKGGSNFWKGNGITFLEKHPQVIHKLEKTFYTESCLKVV